MRIARCATARRRFRRASAVIGNGRNIARRHAGKVEESLAAGLVCLRPASGEQALEIATTAANATTYNDVGLSSGTAYWYRIRSTNASGDSAYSNEASAVTLVPPTVSITGPANNSVFAAPASFTIDASASDPDGSIQKVDFYQDSMLIGTATSSPYGVSLSNLAAGNYSFTAVAADNHNLTTTSSAVAVVVNALPTVSITSPANNAGFAPPANVSVAINAQDPGGSIQRVELYANATLLATLTSAPYTFDWSGIGEGAYTLTAKAVDNNNGESVSAPVVVNVRVPLYFIHADHLGTPRLVADQNQQTVWRWDQAEPFGNNPADENPSGLGTFDFPLRFEGTYADKETGILQNWRRELDPSRGQYLQSDPIGLRAGLNTYLHLRANPLAYTDREGLKPYIFRVTVGGGVSPPRPGISGQVFNLEVTDPIGGQRCNYTVSCIGAGLSARGTPTISAGAPGVTWDDGKECSNCRQFEGTGLAGSIAIQLGPIGYTPVDWLEVPSGPRLDFSGYSPATINIGGGTFYCRFSL